MPERKIINGTSLMCELLVLAILIWAPNAKASKAERKVEEITGVVLAYDEVKPWTTCIDVCKTALIVRVYEPEEPPRYIRVDLRFKIRFPKLLIQGKPQWQFKLARTVHLDERIEEFIFGEDVYGREFKIPIWKRVPGAEDEKLPFGQVLNSYSLVKNRFKLSGALAFTTQPALLTRENLSPAHPAHHGV